MIDWDNLWISMTDNIVFTVHLQNLKGEQWQFTKKTVD